MHPTLPRLSIITPVLNGAATLPRCLDAVAAWGPAVIEHWIIDGGSTDGTQALVQQRIDAQPAGGPLRLLSEPDRGIADAWNKGLRRVSGDWVGIVNADDWYEPEALAPLLPVLQSLPAGQEVIVHGRTRLHDPISGAARESGPLVWIPEKHFRPLEKMPAQHPTCFVPRATYQRIGGFNESFRIAMDYEFLLRAHLAGVQFHYLPQVITNFSKGGVSDRQVARSQREVLAAKILHRNQVLGPVWEHFQLLRRNAMRRWRRRLLGRKI